MKYFSSFFPHKFKYSRKYNFFLIPQNYDNVLPTWLILYVAFFQEPTTDENVKKAEDLFPSFKKEPDSFIACRGQDKPKSTGTTPVMSPGVSNIV